jgi:hypothetical protein
MLWRNPIFLVCIARSPVSQITAARDQKENNRELEQSFNVCHKPSGSFTQL